MKLIPRFLFCAACGNFACLAAIKTAAAERPSIVIMHLRDNNAVWRVLETQLTPGDPP